VMFLSIVSVLEAIKMMDEILILSDKRQANVDRCRRR
jgi:hypothetical protein